MPGTVINDLSALLEHLQEHGEGFLVKTLNRNDHAEPPRPVSEVLEFCDEGSFKSRVSKYLAGNHILTLEAYRVKLPFEITKISDDELQDRYG